MKNVMTRAWEIYKSAGCTCKAEFALALKAAWAEYKAKSEKSLAEKLVEMGGKYWAKGNHERVYVDAEISTEAIGAFWNGGHPEYDGKSISKTTYRRIYASMDGIFLNVKTGKFSYKTGFGMDEDYTLEAIRALKVA